MLDAEQERFISQEAIAQHVKKARQQFVDDILDDVGEVLRDGVSVDSFTGALRLLEMNGYTVEDSSPVAFAHPEAQKELYNDVYWQTRDKLREGLEIHGVRCYTAPELPERNVLIVHPDATAPSIPAVASMKPWVVKDPNGLVRIQPRN